MVLASKGSTPGIDCDAVVVGGGIVGLSVARAFLHARPAMRVVVVEKEAAVATHQSGRNSGVIHSGIYYRPGSGKARMVAAGRKALAGFCGEAGVPITWCGKVIVAVTDDELAGLDTLRRRAVANGVQVRPLDRRELREVEPHARGVAALHVPETGVVDYRLVCAALEREITETGGAVVCSTPVSAIHERTDAVVVEAPTRTWTSALVVNCGGLHADQLAAGTRAGVTGARIVGFRGEFYDLSPSSEHLVNALIYPVPDDRFPFLGVHLTRTVGGQVHAGPNAVLALAREGYSWRDIDAAELMALARFPGFRRLAARHWRMGAREVYRSASKRAFVAAVRRLVPEIGPDDLDAAPSGVRAQAVAADGSLVDDFWLTESPRVVNVVNAPSPAATASLEIGRHIVSSLIARLDAG